MRKPFKIVTIIGARPQFVKAALFSEALAKEGLDEILIHTGQHYDPRMSDIFFSEMGLKDPDYHLGIGGLTHGAQTGRMLEAIEKVLLKVSPELVVVFGDTDSTLAGALAAAKLQIPIAHVEAGVRSWNRDMPEETNRILTDHVSQLLFCPSHKARLNLTREGIKKGVAVTGDIMVDTIKKFARLAKLRKSYKRYGLKEKNYYVLTLHRPANVDSLEELSGILDACEKADAPVLFLVHPRTVKKSSAIKERYKNLLFVEPVGYLDMLALLENAKGLLTDSGGLQKEALYLKVPCITLRTETEWTETLQGGWNQVVGSSPKAIARALKKSKPRGKAAKPYGQGEAAIKMVKIIKKFVTKAS